ncbi:(E,E)-geranyllinalool synthase [Morella rubra]|uniref:(E,E)-geranyllinalool synthase n=1 Tax=Morella rubra TaxID=262757 RepID=A0A6A1W9N3_9ROSI|nr:(E,E)-geranyllinalool synthase [Morella rubra]
MKSSQSSIESQVTEIKEKMFSNYDSANSFISPSAYDTAWLAMIPDPDQPFQPMFKNCLNWVLHNQKDKGFWGECDAHGMPTIECLPETIACIVALKKWNVGTQSHIEKGLAFIHANTGRLLGEIMNKHCIPRWFAIVFPAMVELALTAGVEHGFLHSSNEDMSQIFKKRNQILEKEKLVDEYQYPPLLYYLEALPAESYDIDQDEIIKHLSNDGSIFQSPSATASAFMVTGNEKCLAYLLSLVQTCDNGVPPTYPMDEDLINLCMANQLIRLGLAEHFVQETGVVLERVYRNFMNQKSWSRPSNSVAAQLVKDTMAFRLLRMHGYGVSSDRFCWFLLNEDIRDLIENNSEYFSSAMLNVYRATDLMFAGEDDLQEARSFSKKLLEKVVSVGTREQTDVTFSSLRRAIEHELSLPWFARLDHLEHRMWIEDTDSNILWRGKGGFHRLSCPYNGELVRLAMQNYEFRQSIYKNELEELKSCKECNTYTVADDFYDMEGTLIELKGLTSAVQRWDAKGLSGHCEIIFRALDNLVCEVAAKYTQLRQGCDITNELREIWYETFASWYTESMRSKLGRIPSLDEYLETGMTSIAAHTLVLSASCLLNPSSELRPVQYESITTLLMVISRLLNDTQSYQKEKEEGKVNFVSLHLKENPEADVEETIARVREILEKKKQEFLEQVFMEGFSDLPKPSKHLHLSCLKVFQMFFNSSNRYDSNTGMLEDINKAIYVPLQVGNSMAPKPLPLDSGAKKKQYLTINVSHFRRPCKYYIGRSFVAQRGSWAAFRVHAQGKAFMQPKVAQFPNLTFATPI